MSGATPGALGRDGAAAGGADGDAGADRGDCAAADGDWYISVFSKPRFALRDWTCVA